MEPVQFRALKWLRYCYKLTQNTHHMDELETFIDEYEDWLSGNDEHNDFDIPIPTSELGDIESEV